MGLVGWLIAFSIGSVFIANPFASEATASATPDYWRVMYLHGLLIGMVAILALLVCQVFDLRSRHANLWVGGGAVAATLAVGIGGIFDNQIPGAEVPMWTQIVGFFALDEILVALLAAMALAWVRRAPGSRSLAFVTAWFAAGSMLAAAVMGHLAGWILEFGPRPGFIQGYADTLGISVDDLVGQLTGSHSHDMVVAVMALGIALAARQFGLESAGRVARTVGTAALGVVAFGTVVMTFMYGFMGFTTFSPPTLFESQDGTSGIAGDDILTGVFIMGGGLVVMGAVIAGREVFRRPVRLAAAWSWALSFATVVIAGYAIEMNESYYGAGDQTAAGADKDAVFTWLHQDIGLFLLPALVLVMLVVERFVIPRMRATIAWLTIAGSTLTFAGGLLFVFVDTSQRGSGYAITTVGLLIVGLALLGTMWFGTLGRTRALPLRLASGQRPPTPPRRVGHAH